MSNTSQSTEAALEVLGFTLFLDVSSQNGGIIHMDATVVRNMFCGPTIGSSWCFGTILLTLSIALWWWIFDSSLSAWPGSWWTLTRHYSFFRLCFSPLIFTQSQFLSLYCSLVLPFLVNISCCVALVFFIILQCLISCVLTNDRSCRAGPQNTLNHTQRSSVRVGLPRCVVIPSHAVLNRSSTSASC